VTTTTCGLFAWESMSSIETQRLPCRNLWERMAAMSRNAPSDVTHEGTSDVTREQVEAVMAASRELIGLIAASVAEVDEQVTPAQLRILVLVSTRPGLNLTSLAEELGVHASNATRACDRLVRAGLLSRQDSAHDRRHLHLALTPAGQQLLDTVMDHRRAAFEQVLRRMEPAQRQSLADAMASFAAAAGEAPAPGSLWAP